MSMLNKFQEIVKYPHQFAKEWKEKTGGKVLGYVCTNLPEELMYASGVLPIRILGSNEPETETGPYISAATFCSFCRDCFAQALRGRYDYVDGVTYGYCCPHARHIYESWRRHMSVSYSHQLNMPTNLLSPHAKKYIVAGLEEYKHSLEEWTGQKISLEQLDRAINIYNTSRRLMLNAYELMKVDNPPLTGSEILEMALSSMLIDKEEFNHLMEEALNDISKKKSNGNHGPRLMLLGSVNNNIEFIKFIESLGATIVIDDYNSGNRYYSANVIPGEDRLQAIAERMIQKNPCPLKDLPLRRRPGHIVELAEEYRVKGAIYTIQRMCDMHGNDYPSTESALKEKGIPTLKLELDLGIPFGQFRTRIEAFLEMLEKPS